MVFRYFKPSFAKSTFETTEQNSVFGDEHVAVNLVLDLTPDGSLMKNVGNIQNVRVVKAVCPLIISDNIEYQSNHFLVKIKTKAASHVITIPLAIILGFNAEKVLASEAYQLYKHTLYPKGVIKNQLKPGFESFSIAESYYNQNNSYTYTGITKRTWQQRLKEHTRSAIRHSPLRFHKALSQIGTKFTDIEHGVERAGLTKDQAYNLEEIEVRERTFYLEHENGLNMIPGGYAGLKFISTYSKRLGVKLEPNQLEPDNREDTLHFLNVANIMSPRIRTISKGGLK
jgi:hypothetical protein